MKPETFNIPYGKQEISDDDINEVISTLKSDFLTQGPKISEFETQFANYIGAKYAIAVSNGTSALHLSALSLNVGENDCYITTPITFAASANCIRYCGGTVEFADIDRQTYLIDLNYVEDLIKKNPNKYTGIVAVDFAGLSVNIEELYAIANKYGLKIIEDACHAPGGYFIDSLGKKQYCGNGVYSDLSIFSFHPVKHIAAGEGGMVTTNDEKLYKKIVTLRTHGITKNPDDLKENHGGWYYEMQELGYNYRITDIQAALALSQLKRAKINVEKRNSIAAHYYEAFKSNPKIRIQLVPENYYHAYHLFVIESDFRKDLYGFLRNRNIFTQVHYIPIHLQPYYKNLGWGMGDLPNAEAYYKGCLSLPMYPTLSQYEQDYVVQSVNDYFS